MIGHINGDLRNGYNTILGLLRAIPMTVPAVDMYTEPSFTCRVWFKEAVRILHDRGFVNCPDINRLEQECKGFAMTNQPVYPTYSGYRHFIAQSSTQASPSSVSWFWTPRRLQFSRLIYCCITHSFLISCMFWSYCALVLICLLVNEMTPHAILSEKKILIKMLRYVTLFHSFVL